MSVHLVTGFPGFIGRRLVAALLEREQDDRVIVLVEERMLEAARDAAMALDGGPRIEVLAGDITEPRLALGEDRYARLVAETDVVHHLAAIYDLAVPAAVAHRVNVEGTGNVLAFCAAVEGLERLNYVSTAYVSGDRTGVVYEHELDRGQGFKNHYESTKFQAEVWVRSMLDRVPTTIFRPAIVVGDSRTGETAEVRRSLLRAPLHRRDRGAGDGRRQHRPRRDAVQRRPGRLHRRRDGRARAARRGDRRDRPSLRPGAAQLVADVRAADRALRERSGPATGCRHGWSPPPSASRPVRELYGGTPAESIRYLNNPVEYDTRRAGELLAASGLRCPRFGEYAPAMVSFFREHEDDPELRPAAASR